MKKKLLALAVGSVLSAGAQADITDVLITEYVESSNSQNRAIEITNMGNEDVTFTDNEGLVYFYNPPGSDSDWKKINHQDGGKVLTGTTILAGETIVIIAPPHATYGSDVRDAAEANNARVIISSSLGFTGNDSVAIVDMSDSLTPPTQVLDIIGETGSVPSLSNITMRRSKQVDGSNPTQQSVYVKTDWIEHVNNTFDDLGINSLPEAYIPFNCLDSEARTSIQAIQGEGTTSPITGENVIIEAVISAITSYPVKGIFLAQETDNNQLTSDGLFITTNEDTSNLAPGDKVCLQGVVVEDYGLTTLTSQKEIHVKGSEAVPAAVDIEVIESDKDEYGFSFDTTLERYEGMLVRLPKDMDPNETGNQDMRVSKTISFNFDSFRNNMVFSYKRPNMQPNQENVAGSTDALKAMYQNDDFRLIIESAVKAEDGRIPYYPTFHDDAADNYIRIDDSVVGMEGVLSHSFGDYNLTVTNTIDEDNITHNTDRKTSPTLSTTTTDDSFAIKVATQNLLNLFNSPFGGSANQHGDNRGADSIAEYERQKAKLVSAIRGLDADIVGLMEIENNGYGDAGAIAELVAAINVNYDDDDPKDIDSKYSTSKRYVFIGYDKNGDTVLDDQDSLGTDSISTGLLYRPAKVSLESTKVIPMPQQHAPVVVNDNNIVVKNSNGGILESGDNYQRDTLAGTFIVNQTGKRLTVAVNHLKSKGSTCWEEWDGVDFGTTEVWKNDAPDADFQGACEDFRVAAAVQLGEELDKIGGDTVIVGDMNSYALEDPMLVLTENTTGKTLTTARDTFIGKTPQFNNSGNPVNWTKTYGYINAVSKKDAEKGKASWSYSYNDEIGSLDHLLISPSLNNRLIDATDWHINAAESPLYDYNIDYKGATGAEDFYADDAYRSSDHDSAIMSLSYKHGETDGKAVHVAITSGLIKVPYNIPTAANAEKGDIATITLTPLNSNDNVDMSDVVLPRVALTKDGQSFVELEVYGADASRYSATMQLERTGAASTSSTVSGSSVSLEIEVAKQDSLTPKIVIPPSDNSGGSFGIFGVLSLLGLGFLRRKAK
ncbi:ExeM/NucH family extracellular endonuclease [Moritella sp. 24]|uniref:ExeM/NucH family extracellular endonuclease n=1 Tax=Moritella sp. 24 TaxID=2746230 RepID=UPI001BEE2CE4|nr:ExeM/NucH family extracellular endonuclease [Moritella sp. 24]QUM77821.1 ExeM/NucH family extracellular endonuclease [Moritella sp. 24]